MTELPTPYINGSPGEPQSSVYSPTGDALDIAVARMISERHLLSHDGVHGNDASGAPGATQTEPYNDPGKAPEKAYPAANTAEEQGVENQIPASERRLGDAELAKLSAEAGVMVHMWAEGRGVPAEFGGNPAGQFQLWYTRPLAKGFVGHKTSPALMAEYAAQGASEIVTATVTEAPFGRVNPVSDKRHEPTVVVTYETTSRADERRFRYEDAFGRPGNFIQMHVALPASHAQRFMEAITEDPMTIRRFLDQQMAGNGSGQFGMDPEIWKRYQPNYEKWKQANNGINRIAIRNDIGASPVESQFVTF